jgi:predicted DNA-binding transcriptional regulator AlpA
MTAITVGLREAQQISSLSRASLYRLFEQKKLTPRKFGRKTLVVVSELESFLQSLPNAEV